jgi:hypothetical protein
LLIDRDFGFMRQDQVFKHHEGDDQNREADDHVGSDRPEKFEQKIADDDADPAAVGRVLQGEREDRVDDDADRNKVEEMVTVHGVRLGQENDAQVAEQAGDGETIKADEPVNAERRVITKKPAEIPAR